MSSLIAEVADAVTVELNDYQFSQTFNAQRKWRAKYDLRDLSTLRVAVVPGPFTYEALDRRSDKVQIATDLVVLKRGDPDANSEVDPIVALGEEFLAHFRSKNLSAGSRNIVCVDPRMLVNPADAAVDPDHLHDHRTMVIVIRLTWLVRK
ncbi:MAG TPA: hypothetical protein EYP56_00565 [Planctomycetaceae bacterium]|nr:hypothetical protein [Planctomycetaceae bacterium]